MAQPERADLLQAATTFCEAFASKQAPDALLHYFSANDNDVIVLEHGLPRLAPFLGRPFRGKDGAREYLQTVSRYLTYEDMRFDNYVVDITQGKVSARGRARFTWSSTGQSWDEVFAYMLTFDDEHKVVRYEIWADSGAAFLASQGRLSPPPS